MLNRLPIYMIGGAIVPPSAPTTFAELFGVDLAHLWDSYNGTTWTDSISAHNTTGLYGGGGGGAAPTIGSQNGHSYPIFNGAGTGKGLECANLTTLDGAADYTIAYAFKTRNGQLYGGFMDKANAGSFFYNEGSFGAGSPIFIVGGGGLAEIDGTTPCDDDQWHYAIITCVSDNVSMYIDGVLQATDTGGTIPAGAPCGFYLGVQPNTTVTDSHILFELIATRGLSPTEVGYLDDIIESYGGFGGGGAAPTISGAKYKIIDPLGGALPQTINGTGFSATPTVDVEGTAATGVVYVSPTELTCVMPAKTLPTVPHFVGTAAMNTLVNTSAGFSAGAGSGFILFRADERPSYSFTNYANGNLLCDIGNATVDIGYTNKGVSICVYEPGSGTYKDITFECNVLDSAYHCVQWKWNGTTLYIRLDNGPWKNRACGNVGFPSSGNLTLGVNFGGAQRHRGPVAICAAGPIVISDANFDNILAQIHSRYGIDLGVAKGAFDWTTLALSLLFEPGNFNVGTGNWAGTASAGGSGAVTATSTVNEQAEFSRCYNITVTNPDTQAATLASAVRYWSPKAAHGVRDRGAYVDSRKGVASGTPPNIDSITGQVNGNVFNANVVKPTLVANAFAGYSPAIRTNEVPPLLVGNEGTALLGTSKVIPAAGRMVVMLAVVQTTNQDVTIDWYGGNAPNTIVGDKNGSIETTFGLNGSSVEWHAYRGGWFSKRFGNGATDGKPRLLTVAADFLNPTGSALGAANYPDARGFFGRDEVGYGAIGYDSVTTYNTLFGSYTDGGLGHMGDSFKGDTGAIAVLDLPNPVNEGELDVFEQWAAQSFGTVSGLDFDPRFTGPSGLYLPNGYDATTGVWKAAAGTDVTAVNTPKPTDAGDGTPVQNSSAYWLNYGPDVAATFAIWAGMNRGRHFIVRATTNGPNCFGTTALSNAWLNPRLVGDTAAYTGLHLWQSAGVYYLVMYDYVTGAIVATIDISSICPAGVGDFIAEGKKVWDPTSGAWELWVRATSSTPGSTPLPWVASGSNHAIGDTGGGTGFNIGTAALAVGGILGIKAVGTWRRDLSEWTARNVISFFQKLSAPDTIDPRKQPDCEAWWDTRSITGTVGSGSAVIKNQSVAHPETARDLTEGAGTQVLGADADYAPENSIQLPGNGFFNSALFSSIISQPLRIYWVAKWTSTGSLYLFDCVPADPQATTRIAIFDNGGDAPTAYAGASLGGSAPDGIVAPHVGCAVIDGANSAVYINDPKTPVVAGAAGALDLLSARLFARFSAPGASPSYLVGSWTATGIFKGRGDSFERKRLFDMLKVRNGL